ncbi:MAG: glutamate-5-semialdehyde dehydrogenase [Saprospiraceae bacterium]|nr:glutamate-5-semialdehyde dehydrogenase [Saprospiraceae bacterium]
MEPIEQLLQIAHKATPAIALASNQLKSAVLNRLADLLLEREADILRENGRDLAQLTDDNPKKDRLLLNTKRLSDLASAVRQVATLPNPAGRVLLERDIRPGLHLQKVSVPLGVVGVIYESRPNVTIDVAALCLRSGNVCVLKGGKEAAFSNQILVDLLHEALAAEGLPGAIVTLLPNDREAVNTLLRAERWVDILIPRGSDTLIQFVRENARVPVIETGAGVCHTYVDTDADTNKGVDIVVNAKVSRPSVCNALDTVLVARPMAERFLPLMAEGLRPWSVEIFADQAAFDILSKSGYPWLQKASANDFGREFLSLRCSVAVVDGLDAALEHIDQYSSRHSEAIVTENPETAERFLSAVDAAAVYVNASTRFTDGGEFGLGAEIGISTQKLHARGPFALEKLVTEKWLVRGNGAVRS